MKHILLSTILCFVALGIYSTVLELRSASANPFFTGNVDGVMSLTKGDANIMKSKWEELRDNNLIGVKKEWSNPKTGRSGSIEVLKNFTDEEGRKCKNMRYKYSRQGYEHTYTFMMDRCLDSDGKWKFK